MRLVVPVDRCRRLMPASVRIRENVTPERERRLEISRNVSAPPGNVGRWARKEVG
jgi:hypothetical protein